jgi:hypothetical protein
MSRFFLPPAQRQTLTPRKSKKHSASDEWVQDILEYASRCPLVFVDQAHGVPHESIPDVIKIPLGETGFFALIDAEDYPLVRRYSWRCCVVDGAPRYATASAGDANVSMHRLIQMVGPSMFVDHKNGQKLDNRKANLRDCTKAQNAWNTKISPRNSSGVKGVSRLANGEFLAYVFRHRVMHKQTFASLDEAKSWTEKTRAELHGEFANHGRYMEEA